MSYRMVESVDDFAIIKKISLDCLNKAEEKAKILLNEIQTRNTYLSDNNREIKFNGVLAEVVFCQCFEEMEYGDGIDHDLIWQGKYTIESKTQSCNNIPQPHFVGSTWGNFKYKPVKSQFMVFSRVLNPRNGKRPEEIVFTGIVSTKRFLREATLIKKGFFKPQYGLTIKPQYGLTKADKLELPYTKMFAIPSVFRQK